VCANRFEFYVKRMSGSVFIGLVQAARKVYFEGGQKVMETRTRDLDDNWYYCSESPEFSAWYISDIGTLTCTAHICAARKSTRRCR